MVGLLIQSTKFLVGLVDDRAQLILDHREDFVPKPFHSASVTGHQMLLSFFYLPCRDLLGSRLPLTKWTDPAPAGSPSIEL